MAEAENSSVEHRDCPRCGTPGATVVARSPRPGVWTMHLCNRCFYGWRSTEPDYATQATALSQPFRLDPTTLDRGPVMPAIPPRRGT